MIDRVLTVLIDVRVTLILKECEFFTNPIDYLSHVIRSGCLKGSTVTIDAVPGPEHPTKLRALRSFLCLCNVFQRFVPSFACIAASATRNYGKVNRRSLTVYPTKNISLGDAKSKADRAWSTSAPTFTRVLYCRQGRMQYGY